MNLALKDGQNSIGRKQEGNDIILSDAKISKKHAIISKTDASEFQITDLKSSNGVKVNDSMIPPNIPFTLQDGDIITIGSVALTFYDDLKDFSEFDRQQSMVHILRIFRL